MGGWESDNWNSTLGEQAVQTLWPQSNPEGWELLTAVAAGTSARFCAGRTAANLHRLQDRLIDPPACSPRVHATVRAHAANAIKGGTIHAALLNAKHERYAEARFAGEYK
jgi:hypothetical protein